MDHFVYRGGQLFCEQVDLNALAAAASTPVYVYSHQTLVDHYQRMAAAFAPLEPTICYSIKSCGNIHICGLLARCGAGMDVVSGGELHRARLAGAAAGKIVFAGVGKQDAEIVAALEAKIGYFNIESEAEFQNIAQLARQRATRAHAALRVNPDVDPHTHAKTTTGKKETKFGVDLDQAVRFFARYGRDPNLRLDAIHLHIGSPVLTVKPYVEAITKALTLVGELQSAGHRIAAIDIGGGFGADYEAAIRSPAAADYAAAIVPLLEPFHARGGKVILEPGRSIAANAGVLLTQVQYIKRSGRKTFVIVDSGMHHLVRPTLYNAFHFIWPTCVDAAHVPGARQAQMMMDDLRPCDVVGPICETGDYLALDRMLPEVGRGDLLCVFSAGAYGMAMASNYNAMCRPPEILVQADRARIIRRRETVDDLIAPEREACDLKVGAGPPVGPNQGGVSHGEPGAWGTQDSSS